MATGNSFRSITAKAKKISKSLLESLQRFYLNKVGITANDNRFHTTPKTYRAKHIRFRFLYFTLSA